MTEGVRSILEDRRVLIETPFYSALALLEAALVLRRQRERWALGSLEERDIDRAERDLRAALGRLPEEGPRCG